LTSAAGAISWASRNLIRMETGSGAGVVGDEWELEPSGGVTWLVPESLDEAQPESPKTVTIARADSPRATGVRIWALSLDHGP
jgi:hypothetical protein